MRSLASELVRESSSEKDSFLLLWIICDLFGKSNYLVGAKGENDIPYKNLKYHTCFTEVQWS